MYAGFDAAIMEFEEWVGLLLLEALQQSGFFRAAGQRHRLANMRAAIRPDFSRFIAEAVDLLLNAGKCMYQCHSLSWENLSELIQDVISCSLQQLESSLKL